MSGPSAGQPTPSFYRFILNLLSLGGGSSSLTLDDLEDLVMTAAGPNTSSTDALLSQIANLLQTARGANQDALARATADNATLTGISRPPIVSVNSDADVFFWTSRSTPLGNNSAYTVGTSGAHIPLLNGVNTWSGNQTFEAVSPIIDGAAGTARIIYFATAGSDRWGLYADNTAEGGANAGSNFEIARYSDAGAYIDSPLNINRKTGNAVFNTGFGSFGVPFASLPANPVDGQRGMCNDCTTTTFGANAAGGGANEVPVYYVGGGVLAWKIG